MVEFIRRTMPMSYTYSLTEEEPVEQEALTKTPLSPQIIQQKKEDILKQKHRFAPSLNDLRSYEREQILEYRKPTQNR